MLEIKENQTLTLSYYYSKYGVLMSRCGTESNQIFEEIRREMVSRNAMFYDDIGFCRLLNYREVLLILPIICSNIEGFYQKPSYFWHGCQILSNSDRPPYNYEDMHDIIERYCVVINKLPSNVNDTQKFQIMRSLVEADLILKQVRNKKLVPN